MALTLGDGHLRGLDERSFAAELFGDERIGGMVLHGAGYMTVGALSNALLSDLGVKRSKEERRGLRGKKKRLLAGGG